MEKETAQVGVSSGINKSLVIGVSIFRGNKEEVGGG